jgi:hypothetical protein
LIYIVRPCQRERGERERDRERERERERGSCQSSMENSYTAVENKDRFTLSERWPYRPKFLQIKNLGPLIPYIHFKDFIPKK